MLTSPKEEFAPLAGWLVAFPYAHAALSMRRAAQVKIKKLHQQQHQAYY
jgi:hypothetical protein